MQSRRTIIGALGAAAAAPALAFPTPALALDRRPRAVWLHRPASGEEIHATYWRNGRLVPATLGAVDRLMRDVRAGAECTIDPQLVDLLYVLHARLRSRRPIEVTSGYRTPETNRALAAVYTNVARNSLHMAGKAVDVRLPGVPLARLADAAIALGIGGVGYYPDRGIVHVDTGRPRFWET